MNSTTATTPTETATREPICRPQYRNRQDENGSTLQIALPGVRKEDVKLTLHESNLKVEARRADDVPAEWKTHNAGSSVRRYILNLRLTSRLDGTRTTAAFE